MSREAFAELTGKGLENPLSAHETTLLRAFFTYARWRSLKNSATVLETLSVSPEAISFRYDMLRPMCPCCADLDGQEVAPKDAQILPPTDCVCLTSNYSIQMSIDWFHDIE